MNSLDLKSGSQIICGTAHLDTNRALHFVGNDFKVDQREHVGVLKNDNDKIIHHVYNIKQTENRSFESTLKHIDGKDIKISPLDIVYLVTITTDEKRQYLELPSSLFEQCRERNRALFMRNGIKYDLELKDTVLEDESKMDFISYSNQLKTIANDFEENASLIRHADPFYHIDRYDIPDYYVQKIENEFEISETETKTFTNYYMNSIAVNGIPRYFSLDNLRRIELDKTGVSPVSFHDEFGYREINAEHLDALVKQSEETVIISFGYVPSSTLEILLDTDKLLNRHHIFILQHKNEFNLPNQAFSTFIAGSKVIDTENITAKYNSSHCTVEIHVPLITNNKVLEIQIPKDVGVTLACNVGWGNILGVCCEPSWADAPIAFTAINGAEWYGQVPVGNEFKFVKINNGKVVAWETGHNRRSDGTMESLKLSSNKVEFPK